MAHSACIPYETMTFLHQFGYCDNGQVLTFSLLKYIVTKSRLYGLARYYSGVAGDLAQIGSYGNAHCLGLG